MLKKPYKILCGTTVRQDPEVLAAYVKSLAALKAPADAELRFGFINDGGEEQLEILRRLDPAIVLPGDPRPDEAVYAVTEQTHIWQIATFEHVAKQKQKLIRYAEEAGYTHIFFVDSDLLLEPTTLLSLWATEGDIVNAVFWTRWSPEQPPMPQTWLRHPYGLAGLGLEEHEYLGALARREVVRVAGGGACFLVSTAATRSGLRYHPRLPGLPEEGMWQGEDRTFSILADRLHIRQLADGWPDVYHAYHPDQRTPQALTDAWDVLAAPRQLFAKYGDMVNVTLTPMEDPTLQSTLQRRPESRSIRGRLGGLDLAPEIEAALLEMKPGESRMLDVHFPQWAAVPQYRGKQRIIEVTLVDVKAYSVAPVLADVAFAGVGADV